MIIEIVTGLPERVFYDAVTVDTFYRLLPDARRLNVPAAGHSLPLEMPVAEIDARLDFGQWL